jgi:four helix bundle protein
MQDFRSLKVWQATHQMTCDLYKATMTFPATETYGLTNQMRRAAVSIGSNIAEACGRGGRSEFARFLRIAMGSASELEYQILLARDLGYLTIEANAALAARIVDVKRMLAALIGRVETRGLSEDAEEFDLHLTEN